MGNTLEETEQTNSMEGTTIITDVHDNFSEPSKLCIPNKSLDSAMNHVVDIMDVDMSLQNFPTGVNTPKIIKRARGIKSQVDKPSSIASDKNSTARAHTISDHSSDVPKVRLYDIVLNINSKTGHEEVPPTRREQSRMLSTTNEINKVARNFENDIYELNDESLYKCQSIFDSISDQN